MLDPSLPVPSVGRTFASRRGIRLADMDETGGCGSTRSRGSSRTSRSTTCRRRGGGCPITSGSSVGSASRSARRSSTTARSSSSRGAAGSRRSRPAGAGRSRATGAADIEVDSVWIHLGPEQRPARIEAFGIYAEATAGRPVSTRLELPVRPADAPRSAWALRSTDVDLHGHVNNAVHWQAVEDVAAHERGRLRGAGRGGARLPRPDRPRRPGRARHPRLERRGGRRVSRRRCGARGRAGRPALARLRRGDRRHPPPDHGTQVDTLRTDQHDLLRRHRAEALDAMLVASSAYRGLPGSARRPKVGCSSRSRRSASCPSVSRRPPPRSSGGACRRSPRAERHRPRRERRRVPGSGARDAEAAAVAVRGRGRRAPARLGASTMRPDRVLARSFETLSFGVAAARHLLGAERGRRPSSPRSSGGLGRRGAGTGVNGNARASDAGSARCSPRTCRAGCSTCRSSTRVTGGRARLRGAAKRSEAWSGTRSRSRGSLPRPGHARRRHGGARRPGSQRRIRATATCPPVC